MNAPNPALPARCLLIDAAFTPIQAAYVENGRLAATLPVEGEALHAIFDAAETVLETRRLAYRELDGFLYCAGPGSLLALRLAAMAIEGWRGPAGADVPVLQYYSLHAAAAMHQRRGHAGDFDLFLPVRKDRICVLPVRGGRAGEFSIVPDDALPDDGVDRFALEAGSERFTPPAGMPLVKYDLADLPRDWFASAPLHRVDAPTPFVPSPTVYSAWTGERHRG